MTASRADDLTLMLLTIMATAQNVTPEKRDNLIAFLANGLPRVISGDDMAAVLREFDAGVYFDLDNPPETFQEAWDAKNSQGCITTTDALEHARMGWDMAIAACTRTIPPAAIDALIFYADHGNWHGTYTVGGTKSAMTDDWSDPTDEFPDGKPGNRARRALDSIAEGLTDYRQDIQALSGYRAAVSWIGADSWDGCRDCVDILKLATGADINRNMSADRVARELHRLRGGAHPQLTAHPRTFRPARVWDDELKTFKVPDDD